jgi:hypothetical protein
MTKLGVSSRRDAASAAAANRGRLVRRFAAVPFLGKIVGAKTVNSAAAGAVVGACIVGLIILFLLTLRSRASQPFDTYPGLYVLEVASGKIDRKADLRGVDFPQAEWSADGKALVLQTESSGESPALRSRASGGEL